MELNPSEQDEQNDTKTPNLKLNSEKNQIIEPASPTTGGRQYAKQSSFKDAPDSVMQKQKLLIEKVRKYCLILFDFRNSVDTEELKNQKEMKRKTLLELVDYITASSEGFTKGFVHEIIKMVSINLFRKPTSLRRESKAHDFFHRGQSRPYDYPALKQLQSIETKGPEAFDMDDEEPSMDPAWVHRQVVYELFLRFIPSSDEEQFIDRSFIHNLLDLFQSEDPREREYLKMVFYRIYDKFTMLQSFIRKAINDILYEIIYDGKKHSGISELLETYGKIIGGFKTPLSEEQKFFFIHTLIPLHKMNDLIVFHPQLCDCVTEFIRKDNTLAKTAIDGLLKYWPKTNSSKEVLFLGELGLILEATTLENFQLFMKPLFLKISPCFIRTSPLVAEQALSLWDEDHVKHLILQNSEEILPIIFLSLEMSRNHWNVAVREKADSVSNSFSNHNKPLYDKCMPEDLQ